MKKIVIISVSIVCVALIGLAVAGASRYRRSPEAKLAYLKSELTQTLALTESQQMTLERIADEIIAEHDRLAGTHETFKANLMETLKKETVSADELKALFDTKKPVIDDVMQMAAEHIAEFHNVLTPEQREILADEIQSRHNGRCRLFH
jgi:uncharacterized membrane protein